MDNAGKTLITDPAAEELWRMEDELRVALKEFRRSRRMAYLRLARRFLAGRSRDEHLLRLPGGIGTYSIESVVGLVEDGGALSRGLPPMPRCLARAWVAAYGRGVPDVEDKPLSLRLGMDGLYLEGGNAALIGFESLRMRGEPAFRARVRAEAPRWGSIEDDAGQGRCCPERSPRIAC